MPAQLASPPTPSMSRSDVRRLAARVWRWLAPSVVVLAFGCRPAADAHAPQAATSDGHATSHEHGGHGMPHRFEDADAWARVFDDPERDAWQRPDEVVALLAIAPGMRVADLGAGTGYFLPYLSRAVGDAGHVVGLDIETNMVMHMRDRAQREGLVNVEARVVAPDDPALATAVDRVLVVDTWHHIADRERYASKLAAGLRPGGFVLVVDFTLDSEKGPPREHRLAPEVVVRELGAGGLEARIVAEELPDQYAVLGLKSAP